MATSHRLARLAELAGASLEGDPETEISGLSSIESASSGDLTFVVDARFADALATTRAAAVIVSPEHASQLPDGVAALLCDNPYLAYARVSSAFKRPLSEPSSAHPSAQIADDAQIGKDCRIDAGAVIGPAARLGDGCVVGANTVVGERCTLGKSCVLAAGVVLYPDTELGEAVRIHGGAVIGADGFGYASENGRWVKIEQCGRTVIGDRVEIGANTTVDRGALGDTVIARGVIIDNQVQVAHNCQIGEDTAIAGGTLLAGSVKIGARCQIGGGTCIAGHLEICDETVVTGMTAVTKSISRKGVYTSLIPATERRPWQKNAVWFRRLDKIARAAGLSLKDK